MKANVRVLYVVTNRRTLRHPQLESALASDKFLSLARRRATSLSTSTDSFSDYAAVLDQHRVEPWMHPVGLLPLSHHVCDRNVSAQDHARVV